MKGYTEKELKNKAEQYCSAAEHCPLDVRRKLLQWGASAELAEDIIAGLEEERFLDVFRFCRAFVRDKYRFSGWGRVKIMQALKLKALPSEAILVALEEIDEEEYDSGLRELLLRKYATVSARNEYERKAKLVRFAVGRGYAMSEIMKYVNNLPDGEDME